MNTKKKIKPRGHKAFDATFRVDPPYHRHRTDPGKFMDAYYGALVGCRVMDYGEVEGFPVLVMLAPNGKLFRVAVACDEEMNGPGFLPGLPRPTKVEGGFVEGKIKGDTL